ncbi:RlmE family RNA methyltransferase [Terrihabitans rhizophilus]|jgi:23S rRNA (uridine2552-2'-O)-methyltransferase|uniref:Ribosomal RNA large subunit methyltransferase E n=1 Tax=Terrihabitans rhizophilus TaxID=3092662 RepID=A0ABU4RK77_9HYPH|nr:RlmE family RNA methyltransferase [Terrihabitans sp. PJ23]MDX6805232.1 RlmE family RNA methyltransferase [Terrihabitans sp. PJ23]
MTTKGGAEGGGGRNLPKRLKTARGRTTSQQLWLQRQINDPYVARAKREGFRSRAAYKLIEIDERHHILKPGDRVVDLGAAPGGWAQVSVGKIGAPERGKIVGIDILDIEPIPGMTFAQIDFLDDRAPVLLKEMLGGPADVVLSDMAANTTGHKATDHLRTMGLVEAAAEFATEVLAPGGRFLAKVLQGGTEVALLAELKKNFRDVKHVKPPASRVGSSELYVLATGFRGA